MRCDPGLIVIEREDFLKAANEWLRLYQKTLGWRELQQYDRCREMAATYQDVLGESYGDGDRYSSNRWFVLQ